jgi:hypothetical protein
MEGKEWVAARQLGKLIALHCVWFDSSALRPLV